jgi:hypothetical protein
MTRTAISFLATVSAFMALLWLWIALALCRFLLGG